MAKKLTDAEVGRLWQQASTLVRETVNGNHDLATVKNCLQALIENKLPTLAMHQLPSWYLSPDEQFTKVLQLNQAWRWGLDLSELSMEIPPFVPRTSTEILMLDVKLPIMPKWGRLERTFTNFELAFASNQRELGRDYKRGHGIFELSDHLRLYRNSQYEPGVRWVAFDYAAHWEPEHGNCVSDLWASNSGQLASSENLVAAMLFPEWVPSMDGVVTPYVDMAGYQMFDAVRVGPNIHSQWMSNPQLSWNAQRSHAVISKVSAVSVNYQSAAPTIRVL